MLCKHGDWRRPVPVIGAAAASDPRYDLVITSRQARNIITIYHLAPHASSSYTYISMLSGLVIFANVLYLLHLYLLLRRYQYLASIFSAQIHGLSTPAYIGGLEVGDVLVSNNIYPS